MNKQDYQRYLQSPHWQARRLRRLSVAGHRCEFRPIDHHAERCQLTQNLEVHHLHYDTLCHEKDIDLEVLCRFHHLVREAVGGLDCPTCGDGPMDYDEEDIIRAVEEEIAEVGSIHLVDVQSLRDRCSWHKHCSYCER